MEVRQYDSRLRLTQINDELLTNTYYEILSYAPNGDVLSTDDEINGSWTFTYDDFNRLASATLATPSAAYTDIYDRYGNRWDQYLGGVCTAGTSFCVTFDANNHVNNGSLTYDAAGNVIADSQHHYAFDAENRLISVDAGVTATYIYDAQGNRVRKTTPVASLDYLYDLANRPFVEVTVPASGLGTWDRSEVFAGSRHLATYTGGPTGATYNNFADALGTVHRRTTYAGATCETITNLPFGDGQQTTGTCGDPSPMHFTGKERDLESGLDNFGARYHASSLGRFMSPDPMHVMEQKKGDPQQWNMYTYVRNNPLRMVDANGKWPTEIHNQIIDKAFPGLSAHQRDILKSASYKMDHCMTCQSEGNSFQHSMRAPGENPAAAKQKTEDFIGTEEHLAQGMQKTTPADASKINDRSLDMFGNAAHTVADGTSPAHVDAQGNPLPWDPYSPSAVKAHEEAESTISSDEMDAAINALRKAFQQTYGQTAAQQAATPPPQPPICAPNSACP
jgi:RHS repeat-associated protein